MSDVSVIQKARDTKKLVIFVGSGVSVNSEIPNWNSMLENIKDDIGIDKNDTEDALQIAQIYFNERKQKEYIERIRDILHHKKKKYNQINEAIFDLKPEHVLTTNYDDLLEQVIRNRALPFSVVKKDNDFPYSANSNLLVKIHGDLDSDDFVLKEDDYLEYEINHPLFEAFIKSIFSTKLVIFIGYSFSDINLKIILQKVRNILGKNYQNSYLITHNSFSDFKINYLREKGVNVLSYEDNREYINYYLDGNNVRSVDYNKRISSLEEIGKNLLHILTFINVYNRFEEELAKYDYVSQMKISLERFSALNTLPYFFIANLFPFNNSSTKVFYNEHEVYSLNVKNEKLIDFLKENVEYTDNNTRFSQEYLLTLKDEKQKKRTEEDLKYVIHVLNHSAINKVKFEDYKNFSDDIVLYNNYGNKCDCFTCLINQLKLDKLIDKLLTTDINDASDVQEDAKLAYAHYKSGNVYQAYNLFEEIAQKAWHAGKYIIYFISKYNLKRLGHIIHWKEFKNLSSELIQEINSKADKIDLDAVYRQINEISQEEATLIKQIRDNEVLKRSSEYISKEYEKLKQLRKNLDNGGSNSSFNSEYIIDFHLVTVDMFYNRNFIVNDVFTEYLNMYNMGIKSLLLNYTIYRDYSGTPYIMDYQFCFYFIYYGKYDELKEIINEYKVSGVSMEKEDIEKVYEIIINYYNSFVDNNLLFGKHEVNHKMHNQVKKAPFDYKFVDIFDNISLLIGIIDFGKDKFDDIFNHIAISLKDTDFFYPRNIANLEYIFRGNYNYISKKSAEDFLSILLEKPDFLSEDIFGFLAYVFMKKNNDEKIDNVDLIEKLIIAVDRNREDNRNIRNNFYLEQLFHMVNDTNKQLISNKIISILEKDFYVKGYWISVMNNIIKYDSFFEKYLSHIALENFEIVPNDFSYSLVGKKRTSSNIPNNFVNFIRLLYNFDLQEKFDIKSYFKSAEEYMKFYFNPDDFDASDFRIEWVFCTYEPKVHEALSKIEYVRTAFDNFVKDTKGKEYIDLYSKYYIS